MKINKIYIKCQLKSKSKVIETEGELKQKTLMKLLGESQSH